MFKKISVWSLIIGILLFSSSSAFAAEESKHSIVKFGESIEVPSGTEVDSAVAIGGSVTVYGNVREDVVAIGGSVYLKNQAMVGGDAVSIGGAVEKSPRAIVKGEVTELSFGEFGPMVGSIAKEGILPGIALFSLLSFLGFLVLVIILVALFPNQLEAVSAAVEGNLLKTFLFGLLVVLIFLPMIILLAITIFGIPLIPIWVIVVAAAGLFGYIGAAHLLGRKILKAFKLNVKTMMVEALTGVIVLALVGFVPFAGFIIKLIASCLGLGGVVLTRFGTQKA